MAIELIAKIAPKNNGFTGMVDANQIIGDGASNVLPSNTIGSSTITEPMLSMANTAISGYYISWDGANMRWAAIPAASGAVSAHNDLLGLQGGTTDEYYHLTNAQVTALHSAITVLDSSTVDLTLSGQQVSASVISSGISHNDLSGLTVGDPHTQYLPKTTWNYMGRYGFINTTQTSIGFDGTNTFTLTDAGSGWSYFRGGILYTITGNKTVTLSGTPPASKGIYYIYIDATDGTLTCSTSAWTLLDTKVPVATIAWDNALTPKYWMMDERHTCLIDRRTHYYEHTTEGTKYISGGTLSGYVLYPTATGDTDTDNTFAIAETYIADEDLNHTLSALTDPNGTATDYVVFYRTASSTWSWIASAMPYYYTASGYINYDSSGTMVEGSASNYYNSYLLYTNLNGAARYILVNGRGQFSTLVAAQAENPGTFSWSGIPIAEFVIAYQFTWETKNSYASLAKCTLATTPKRLNISLTQTSVGASTLDHNSLAGIQGGTTNEYYHLTNTQISGLHNPITVGDTDRIDITISGQYITADIVPSSITSAYILDNTITEPKLNINNAPTSGYYLSWNGANMFWAAVSAIASGGSGSNMYIDQAGGTGDTFGVLAGTRNGVNTEFTVSKGSYISGTLVVYLNGQLLTQGSAEDWHEHIPASGNFHFTTAPEATDEITAMYGYQSISSQAYNQAFFTIENYLVVASGLVRIPNHTGRTLTMAGFYADIDTPPSGASLIIDINKNGTTIFTNQANRLTVLAGANTGYTNSSDIITWEDGQYLTMDIDQVGSLNPGYNLTTTIRYY